MFIITSIYFLMLFLIFWSYCGYTMLLSLIDIISPQKQEKRPVSSRTFNTAVFVPCLNDEIYVERKVENLKSLNLPPGRTEILFLCGLSTDNTNKKLLETIRGAPNFHVIETGCVGKINQFNFGLSILKDFLDEEFDIIVGTDIDTNMAQDVLVKFAEEFSADEKVAVLGANISPGSSLPIEEVFWRDQNMMRILETNVHTSSIVAAPCFAYRNKLMDRFPDDCVADDIYVAFKANSEGFITRYVESATATELRNPASFGDFFRHKFRKGNAYLIELFRFLYRLPHMSGWWKMIFLTKFLQLVLIPWILFYFILATISLALSRWGLAQLAFLGIVTLLFSLLMTRFLIGRLRRKYFKGKPRTGYSIVPFIVSNIILVLVGLSYPFYRQTSNYSKIKTNEKPAC